MRFPIYVTDDLLLFETFLTPVLYAVNITYTSCINIIVEYRS